MINLLQSKLAEHESFQVLLVLPLFQMKTFIKKLNWLEGKAPKFKQLFAVDSFPGCTVISNRSFSTNTLLLYFLVLNGSHVHVYNNGSISR